MAKLLKLPQFIDEHGVAQMQIRRRRIEPGFATLEDTAAALSVARAAANSMRLQESPKGHLQPLSLPRPQPGRAILQSD